MADTKPSIEFTRFDPVDWEDHLHGLEIAIDGTSAIVLIWDEQIDRYRVSIGYDQPFSIEMELDDFVEVINTGKRLLRQA